MCVLALALGSGSLFGCTEIVGGEGGPGDGGVGPARPPDPLTSDQVDLLLVVDNSSSMADKQVILAGSIRSLIGPLINPPCVDYDGNFVVQPSTPEAPCPGSSVRRFKPVRSMHLGVIDSSLAAVGANQCAPSDTSRNNDDDAHLLVRSPTNGIVPTYLGYRFLAWDPDAELSPQGMVDPELFIQHAIDLVVGAGQIGCGYEMPLESAYRFLVDPAPYASIQLDGAGIPVASTSGLDIELLAERDRFLRPNSLVGVVLLSDENDCSTRVGAQDYAVLDAAPWFRGASVCATDPLDPCCYSCGLGPPPGCNLDPVCAVPKYSAAEDSVNLRCWNQMRRYGHDSLYPVARYVNAFTQRQIDPSVPSLAVTKPGKAIVNPLFESGRASSLFVMTGIVGVPWQTIVRVSQDPSSGFKSAAELDDSGFWGREVGDPDRYEEPTDPIMIETYRKRGPTPGAPNGGDRSIDTAQPNDLQYACIFELPTPLLNGPDCRPGSEPDNPVCMGTTEVAAKAYPGLRELAVLHGLGDQGRVGSICAPVSVPSSTDPASMSFGYNAAMRSMIDRIASSLAR